MGLTFNSETSLFLDAGICRAWQSKSKAVRTYPSEICGLCMGFWTTTRIIPACKWLTSKANGSILRARWKEA